MSFSSQNASVVESNPTSEPSQKPNRNTNTQKNKPLQLASQAKVNTLVLSPQKIIQKEYYIFGDFFGYIPEKYIKLFNILLFQLTSLLFYAAVYYYFLLQFDTYFTVPDGFKRSHFVKNKLFIAFNMSVNFQTTAAYVDIKCKSIITRIVICAQIISSFLIIFLFAFV